MCPKPEYLLNQDRNAILDSLFKNNFLWTIQLVYFTRRFNRNIYHILSQTLNPVASRCCHQAVILGTTG